MLLAIRWQKLENNISRNFVLGFIHMYHMICIHGNQTETLQIITCKIVLRKISFGAYFSLEFVHSMRFTFTDQTDYIGRISYRNNFRCKLQPVLCGIFFFISGALLPSSHLSFTPLRNRTHLIEKSFTINGSPKLSAENNRITNLKFYRSTHSFFISV